MASFKQRDNEGTLFRNDKRESDTHPNAKGTALIGGVEYWMDCWTNNDKNGNRYQKIKFRRKEGANAGARPDPSLRGIEDDEEIPF